MVNRWNTVLGVVVTVLLVAVLAVQLTGSPLVHAATSAVSTPQVSTREVTVTGEGMASAQPDIAQASLGVQVLGPTVAQATQENDAKMAAVIAKLKGLGVADKDIQTTGYNIFPQSNFQGGQSGEITGYQVSDTVQVTIRDLSKVSTILDQVTQAGANNVFGVTFGLESSTQLQSEAIDKAVADARTRADELAKAGGVQLGDVVSISQVITPSPMPFGEATAQAAGGAAPIQVGTVQVNAQVQISYAIK